MLLLKITSQFSLEKKFGCGKKLESCWYLGVNPHPLDLANPNLWALFTVLISYLGFPGLLFKASGICLCLYSTNCQHQQIILGSKTLNSKCRFLRNQCMSLTSWVNCLTVFQILHGKFLLNIAKHALSWIGAICKCAAAYKFKVWKQLVTVTAANWSSFSKVSSSLHQRRHK